MMAALRPTLDSKSKKKKALNFKSNSPSSTPFLRNNPDKQSQGIHSPSSVLEDRHSRKSSPALHGNTIKHLGKMIKAGSEDSFNVNLISDEEPQKEIKKKENQTLKQIFSLQEIQ